MNNVFIKTGDTEESFFNRGKELARLADAGKKLPHECVISFEDAADLFKLMTETRMKVFRTIKEHPDSITGIADRLKRDRSAVSRDIVRLADAGLVKVEIQAHPGHGRMKHVSAAADEFKLEASM